MILRRRPNRPILVLGWCVVAGVFTSVGCYRDSIAIDGPVRDEDGDTLVSEGRMFELGFFSAGSDERRYVGIWYYGSSPKTVVWVANREDPVLDSGGVLGVTRDGGLRVSDGSGKTLYLGSAMRGAGAEEKEQVPRPVSVSAKLMDTGNLVVEREGVVVWQSFEHPTDTFLPGMKMDSNLTLVSWKTPDDPSLGNFSFGLDQDGEGQYVVRKRSLKYWKSGVSGKFITSDDMPYILSYLLSNFTTAINSNASIPYITESLYADTRLVVSSSGQVQYLKWDSEKVWSMVWGEPKDRCSIYNTCGDFGTCNTAGDVMCRCLPGFRPSSLDFWDAGDYSSGCTRKSALCSKDARSYTFLSLRGMKVGKPDSQFTVKEENECKSECLNSCQCQAYSFEEDETVERGGESNDGSSRSGGICWIWTESLNNLQDGYEDGRGLFIRVAADDIELTARNCETCGTYTIPYPLSTGPKCGDPQYLSFHCNVSSGEVSFETENGTYRVTNIIPESRKFLIQADQEQTDSCNGSSPPLVNVSMPFHAKQSCDGHELEISWEPPPEPTCIASTDCIDWPDSTCGAIIHGGKRCLCNRNFRWDPILMNCTRDKRHERVPIALVISVSFTCITVLTVLSSVAAFIYVHRRAVDTRRENWILMRRNSSRLLYDSSRFKDEDKTGIDVPFFNLESILAATDNFSRTNKLGQGGFGIVYKGKFVGGQTIAVKRLATFSGQGFEEFKNEVVLIAKLQHRNLVRLLGYCVDGEEKVLLYEYMPNKSLDSFIFDMTLRVSLDWEMRFKIILGIARGLLYLHQDSRLRIIHRDLKTSNILLDEEMNPKISDFGLARIFGGNETAVNTNRVVGTLGYMSPEYAIDGIFSDKSDMFSFGVVVLEILSGRRNTGFIPSGQALSLLGHAWLSWNEGNGLEFMDPMIRTRCDANECMRCLIVGLLCIQEDPSDRPTMSNAMLMLGSDTAVLPLPKPPAFISRRCPSSRASSSDKIGSCSHNKLTITLDDGR
ncbi:hypothetical protein MLD38_019978 [Melastoma candidum]|uniref:Uncharacterized protein n=1 Tax=Melastoma candidum TaxID=119954 RepID=A0ACB9QBN5_9MYRT|nr:hypothetical protein MLD38_019978 [Melastoma candidum]